MEKKGLCTTCIKFETCIFDKKPTIWQCEEFTSSNHIGRPKQAKRCMAAVVAEITESE